MSFKDLTIYSDENKIIITCQKELDYHKERLYISDREKTSISNKLKSIHDNLKANKNYKGCNLQFGEIDHYDSCNEFEVPYFSINRGDRKVRVVEDYSNDIPKGWTEDIQIKFERPKQYGIIIKAVSEFLRMTPTLEKNIKKGIKNNQRIDIQIS